MKIRRGMLCAVLGLLIAPAFAESAVAIHARMDRRLPQIDALKAKEAVGENNRGFVEERKGGVAGAAAIVAEENRDREAVYALLASQTGATSDSVGRARARQTAANSRPGVWVQDESGRWQRK